MFENYIIVIDINIVTSIFIVVITVEIFQNILF